ATQLSDASSQLSTVQSTPSSHSTGTPGWQSSTASQVSTPSQKAPLSHALSSASLEQLSESSSQKSTVHETPSSQTGAVAVTQPVAPHVSTPSQKTPLSHRASSGVVPQVFVVRSHRSMVQSTPSSQSASLSQEVSTTSNSTSSA